MKHLLHGKSNFWYVQMAIVHHHGTDMQSVTLLEQQFYSSVCPLITRWYCVRLQRYESPTFTSARPPIGGFRSSPKFQNWSNFCGYVWLYMTVCIKWGVIWCEWVHHGSTFVCQIWPWLVKGVGTWARKLVKYCSIVAVFASQGWNIQQSRRGRVHHKCSRTSQT